MIRLTGVTMAGRYFEIVLVGLMIVLLTVIGGCGGMQPGVSSSPTASDPAGQSNGWVELLRVLPSNNITRLAVFASGGADLPENFEELQKSATPYATGHIIPMFSRFDPSMGGLEEWNTTFGFGINDVNREVWAGTGPNYYQAVGGAFDAVGIDRTVKTGPLNDILEIASYNGQEFYSWGADNETNLARKSAVRPLGQGGRLALVDDFIFWVPWTTGIQEMIDCYDGNTESLADKKEYQFLTDGLVQLGAFNAFFSVESQSIDYVAQKLDTVFAMEPAAGRIRYEEELERAVRLTAYDAIATGSGLDSKGYYAAIVLLNTDEATAKQNASLLARRIAEADMVWRGVPWSSFVETSEITSEGRLTLAKLYGPACEWWANLGPSGEAPYEPLLVYE